MIITIWQLIFEDKNFRDRGYLSNLENILKLFAQNLFDGSLLTYPQKFIHENFCLNQISYNP